ncbi:MAG: hypothetical protein WD939_09710 [Dehalococcoidia bacterium]
MSKRVAFLVGAVAGAGGALLVFGLSRPTSDDLLLLLALIVVGALAERYAVGLFHSDVSVGVAAVLVAAVIAGLWGVAIVAPPIVLAGQLRTEAAWYKRLHNVGTYLLAGAAFAGIFRAFGVSGSPDAWPQILAPALLGALANYAINSGLIAAAIGVSEHEPVLARWRASYQWLLPQYLVIGLASTAAASAYYVLGIWGLVVFAAPVLAIHHALSLGAQVTPRDEVALRRAA